MPFKTENEFWADMVLFVREFIANNNDKLNGWTVQQGDQPTLQGLKNNTIYLFRVNARQYGWQHRRDMTQTDGTMVHQERYFEEVLMQVSAFKKRNVADTAEIMSGDALNLLIAYIQSSAGISRLRELGYQSIRIGAKREPSFDTDSRLREKIPSFDFYAILLQTIESTTGSTRVITGRIERI